MRSVFLLILVFLCGCASAPQRGPASDTTNPTVTDAPDAYLTNRPPGPRKVFKVSSTGERTPIVADKKLESVECVVKVEAGKSGGKVMTASLKALRKGFKPSHPFAYNIDLAIKPITFDSDQLNNMTRLRKPSQIRNWRVEEKWQDHYDGNSLSQTRTTFDPGMHMGSLHRFKVEIDPQLENPGPIIFETGSIELGQDPKNRKPSERYICE